MTDNIEIRESMQIDLSAIESLYPDALPDEDLLPLLRDLLREAPVALSLVGTIDSRLVGHVIFTRCRVAGSSDRSALLGQLARWGFPLVDCQMHTPHLARFGAREIPRADFLAELQPLTAMAPYTERWEFDRDPYSEFD